MELEYNKNGERGEEEGGEGKIKIGTENKEKIAARELIENGLRSKKEEKSLLDKKTKYSQKFFENLTWLTSNEAADYLRLPSVGALRVLVCKRRVPFHKLGRSLRFKRAELDRLLEASRSGGL
jgi:excisionase family DNA binding protein